LRAKSDVLCTGHHCAIKAWVRPGGAGHGDRWRRPPDASVPNTSCQWV